MGVRSAAPAAAAGPGPLQKRVRVLGCVAFWLEALHNFEAGLRFESWEILSSGDGRQERRSSPRVRGRCKRMSEQGPDRLGKHSRLVQRKESEILTECGTGLVGSGSDKTKASLSDSARSPPLDDKKHGPPSVPSILMNKAVVKSPSAS